jgi:hypothetical protein
MGGVFSDKTDIFEYDGGVYEGLYSILDGIKVPDGSGKITYPTFIYEGVWRNLHVDWWICLRIQEGIYKWKNGNGKCHVKYNINGQLISAKSTTHIKQEDFKLDAQFLTSYLISTDEIVDRKAVYELNYEGNVDKLARPDGKGELYITGVFKFTGEWIKGKINGQGILYDVKNKRAEITVHNRGVKYSIENAIPSHTTSETPN